MNDRKRMAYEKPAAAAPEQNTPPGCEQGCRKAEITRRYAEPAAR